MKDRNAFFDIRVFNPNAFSYRHLSIDATYRKHELEKKRQYNTRIREVEHGSFTPLVFASTGGMSKKTTVLLKQLASDVAAKENEVYAQVIGLLGLMRAAITILRSSRRRHRTVEAHDERVVPTDVVVAEAQIRIQFERDSFTFIHLFFEFD